MSTKMLVVAPHPDDETLGCGGTLLRYKEEGAEINWLIATQMQESLGFSVEQIQQRKVLIEQVAQLYGFAGVHSLPLPTTRLDGVAFGDIVKGISEIFEKVKPEVIYLPYRGDVHTDHRLVFDAAVSCTKWFRYPYVKRILAYETLSETDFGVNPEDPGFRPNVFIDVEPFMAQKRAVLNLYQGELGDFPFPRSLMAVEALARVRGAAAGCKAAEAFMLIKEIL
jgi:LmbE family N-acetylglucosaminyl deacetylase